MKLTFSKLFFVDKSMFAEDKRQKYELHQRQLNWVWYGTFTLGLWLMAGPPTFGYSEPKMIWSDLIIGFLVIVFSYLAMKPYKLWAQWALVFLGTWLFIAPMIFWAKEGAALLNDYFVGTLLIFFAIIIPEQPGIRLFEQTGPNVPKGWSYNPSSWQERVPVVFLSWIGFFVARYMAAYQMGYIDSAWDPFFGDGTEKVLDSEVSHAFPVSDALLGAFSYLFDVLFGLAGNTHRWRTMPWVVIIFGVLIIPLGIVSITLVILQPVSVGFWCTLCLTSATISLIMIPFTLDEVLATLQLLRYEKKKRNRSYWNTFWFGGNMEEGSLEDRKDPTTLIDSTLSEMVKDILLKPWNYFVVILLGLWTMAAPDVLNYSGSISDSNHLVGALVVTFALISMSEVARPLRFINILLGIWIIMAPWVLQNDIEASKWNGIISGLLIILFSIKRGKILDERGGFEKYMI